MNRLLLGIFLTLTSFTIGMATTQAYEVHNVLETRYVGFTYSKLPDNLKSLGGMLVESTGENEYAVSWVEREDPKTHKKLQMLWLEQITRRVKGVAHYRVLAVQNIPPYGPHEVLAMGNCRTGDVRGGGDGRTIAVVVQQDKRVLKKVRAAWRADPENARFEFPDTKRVQCLNEGGED